MSFPEKIGKEMGKAAKGQGGFLTMKEILEKNVPQGAIEYAQYFFLGLGAT